MESFPHWQLLRKREYEPICSNDDARPRSWVIIGPSEWMEGLGTWSQPLRVLHIDPGGCGSQHQSPKEEQSISSAISTPNTSHKWQQQLWGTVFRGRCKTRGNLINIGITQSFRQNPMRAYERLYIGINPWFLVEADGVLIAYELALCRIFHNG